MKKIILLSTVLLVSLSLNGCILFHGYTPTVQQGNELIPAKVNQLSIGMTKGQVQDIMGPPIYVTTFSDNRWDYVYTYKKGGKPMFVKHVIVSFSNGVVSNIQKNLSDTPEHYKHSLL